MPKEKDGKLAFADYILKVSNALYIFPEKKLNQIHIFILCSWILIDSLSLILEYKSLCCSFKIQLGKDFLIY